MASLATLCLVLLALSAAAQAQPRPGPNQPLVSVFDGAGEPQEGVRVPVKEPKAAPAARPAGYDVTRKIVTFNDKEAGESSLLSLGAIKLLDLPAANAGVFKISLGGILGLLLNGSIKSIEDDPPVFSTAGRPRKLLQYGVLGETVPYGVADVQSLGLSDSEAGSRHVCIIDSGYDYTHPDLQGVNIDPPDTNIDYCGHGTHVLGTIAAIGGNDIGVQGIAPHGKLRVSTVAVFTTNKCEWTYASDLYGAMYECLDRGADVISMSLASTQNDTVGERITRQLYETGLLLVAAAGNEGSSIYEYPASFETVISVAAYDKEKNSAVFSVFNDRVDLSAPGVDVNSTYSYHYYSIMSGTSMSVPHVSGVAALVWSRNTQCTNKQIRNALFHTAQDLGAKGRDDYYGYGGVRALAADTCLKMLGCGCPWVTCPAGNGMACTGALTWDQPLPIGQVLWSPDRTKLLFMQWDSNLVVYNYPDWHVLFVATGTFGTGAKRAVLQPDGNFVVYANQAQVWSTGTAGSGATRAVMQNDGHFVLADVDGNVKWTSADHAFRYPGE